MAKAKILLVDDEPRVIQLVRANLTVEGYDVIVAEDGVMALQMLRAENPDLVILDLMLPKLDGYEVARRAREFAATPIIMLTARTSEVDLMRGFDIGADDYLTKPFSINELIARVRAVLRRSKSPEELVNRPPLQVGDLTIDFAQHRVLRGAQEIQLTPLEYRLLSFLASNAGRVMVHEDILRHVWGPEYRDATEYLRVYVRYLRQKIEKDPSNPQAIVTKTGVGYMFQLPEGQARMEESGPGDRSADSEA